MLSTRPVSPEHPLSAPPGPPARCIALYNFSAENPDEINMVRHEDIYTSTHPYLHIYTSTSSKSPNIYAYLRVQVYHEEVELLGDGEDEGWARVRNYKGEQQLITIHYPGVASLILILATTIRPLQEKLDSCRSPILN